MRGNRIGAVVATAAVACTGACSSSSPAASSPAANGLTGYGATLATWNRLHTEARGGFTGLPAYGPAVVTPQGPNPQFIDVVGTGAITNFVESLPKGTSLAMAKSVVLALLPPDTAVQGFTVTTAGPEGSTSSCGYWNLASAAVGSATGNRLVSVEMAYDNAVGTPTWNAAEVNTLTFRPGTGRANTAC